MAPIWVNRGQAGCLGPQEETPLQHVPCAYHEVMTQCGWIERKIMLALLWFCVALQSPECPAWSLGA